MSEKLVLEKTFELAKSKGFVGINITTELPSQVLLQNWLRNEKDIIVFVEHEGIDDSTSAYTWNIKKYVPEGIDGSRKKDEWDFWERYDSLNNGQMWWKEWEDTLENGLIAGLKLIKN